MIRLSQRAQFSHQVGSFESLDGKALPFVLIWGTELEASVRGVERDLHVLSGPGTAQDIDLSAQRHSTDVASLAEPSTLAQVGVHTGKVQQLGFPLRTVEMARSAGFRVSYQWWEASQRRTRKPLIEKSPALYQRTQQGFPVGESLAFQHLLLPSLVTSLDHRSLCRPIWRSQDHVYPQGQEPHVKPSREWRLAQIVVENAVAIHSQEVRQSPLAGRRAKYQLIVGRVWMSACPLLPQPARITH